MRKIHSLKATFVFFFSVLILQVLAQQKESTRNMAQLLALDPYELNLTQLSKLKISSASKVTQKINEVPSTVFVITRSTN